MSTTQVQGPAVSEYGRSFLAAATGRWAGERMLEAFREGRPVNASLFRTNDLLRREEWKAFDDVLQEEAAIRLRGIADLISAGLTIPVANAMGKTVFEYESISDMEEAVTSLDGLARSDNDRIDFGRAGIPLPITHKDFNIGLRTLTASRTSGEPLDTTQARVAGRKVAERLEYMLFRGGPTFMALPIYGYTTHPNRNTAAFGTNGNWVQVAKTGENMIADITAGLAVLQADSMPGPYWIYLPANYSMPIENDFKATSDKSIRTRILELDGVSAVRVVDQLPANNIIIVQATRDVVALVDGEGIQTVQWDIYGGFAVAFKAFAIQIPLIRSNVSGKSGIYHIS